MTTKAGQALTALIMSIVMCAGVLFASAASAADATEQEAITAINILFEPDAGLVGKAEAVNRRLRENYPKGFALDDSHQPHITCLQIYVKTTDLDRIYMAVAALLSAETPQGWTLKAHKLLYLPWQDAGVAAIVIAPTEDVLRFQRKLIEATRPFALATATASAFATTADAPEINQQTIDYVSNFVANSTGSRYKPHVTVGMAYQTFLDRLLAEPFESFSFSPTGVSIYQLGNFGTARKLLKHWEFSR